MEVGGSIALEFDPTTTSSKITRSMAEFRMFNIAKMEKQNKYRSFAARRNNPRRRRWQDRAPGG
jgi:hypothetical protein